MLQAKFDPQLAAYLARCSAAAYLAPGAALDQRCAALGLVAQPFAIGECRGFLGSGATRRVLAFEGTASRRGWIADARCCLVKHSDFPGLVHAGFAGLHDAAFPVVSALAKPPDPRPLYITGHSLGGIQATYFQFSLSGLGIPVRAAYTFGEPRGGDEAWSNWFDALTEPHFRVVRYKDPVPRVPLPPLYRHVGEMIWLDAKGLINPSPSVWREAVWCVEEALRHVADPWAVFPDLAAQHSIDGYASDLDRNLQSGAAAL